jgi:superfamily II DNA or RNA helicase
MSVGAGKTVLGVFACLQFAEKRALIITPGNVIKGTFDDALNVLCIKNAFFGLAGGPLLRTQKTPSILVVNSADGPIESRQRSSFMAADIVVANFHSMNAAGGAGSILTKLAPEDIDFIVVDEAHMAAADSYKRALEYFIGARCLLMSACFHRHDGKGIEADVVYRYRLIDAVADGHAKPLAVHRFDALPGQTRYAVPTSDGTTYEIVGRDALLKLLQDENKIDRVTMTSERPIRTIAELVRRLLNEQSHRLRPMKPRVLFSALGMAHAQQIARIATSAGIPTDYLHYSMGPRRIRAVRDRFERSTGDLQGLVHLKMLGYGYDLPPITIIVPMRPYGSFGEFYQFLGRGIRMVPHADAGRPNDQRLDVVFHGELGFEDHLRRIALENGMDPLVVGIESEDESTNGDDSAIRDLQAPGVIVTYEYGSVMSDLKHTRERIEEVFRARESQALAQHYAAYVQATSAPVSFEQFVTFTRELQH